MRFTGNGITNCYPDQVEDFISITVLSVYHNTNGVGTLRGRKSAGVLQGRRATGPATASEKNGSENRPDRPTAVGPVFAPATRGGPAAPLHAERRRPAAHRGAPAPPQQAGLRAAAVRAPLPGPPAGSGRVHSAGGGGFHRPPARPRRGTNWPTTRCGPRPGTSILPSCAGPRRNGYRPCRHGRVRPVEPRVGGLQPLPPLHAAHAAHAGHRGVARGHALAGSRRRLAQRRQGAADRLPPAEFEVEQAAAHPTRPPPVGDGGVVPPARCVPRRRPLAGTVAPLRRHQEDAAVGSRCR